MALEAFKQSHPLTMGVELELQLVSLSDHDLTGAGQGLGTGDDAIARMEPELTGRIDGDEALDRQAAGGRTDRAAGAAAAFAGGAGLRHGRPPLAAGQPARASHGPIIAWWARMCPWRSS